MIRNPNHVLQCTNNVVTVALPLTSIDIDEIVNRVSETIGRTSIKDLEDVDTDTFGLQDGYMLVFDEITQKWQSTNILDRQIIDAGEY